MAREGVDLDPAAWGARYAEHYTRTPIGPVARLVVHHTAGRRASSRDDLAALCREMEAYGHNRDGADVEYHAVVGAGLVAEGFAPRFRGCHAVAQTSVPGQSYNALSLGLVFAGYYWPPYDDVLADADLDAAARWIAARVRAGDLTAAALDRAPGLGPTKGGTGGGPGYVGHRDVDYTACPGTVYDRLGDLMARARALVTDPDLEDDDMTPEQAAQLAELHHAYLTNGWQPGLPAGYWCDQEVLAQVKALTDEVRALAARIP